MSILAVDQLRTTDRSTTVNVADLVTSTAGITADLVGYNGGQVGEVDTTIAGLVEDDFNIVRFGANPNNTDITAALQAAITACTVAGRGKVYIPAGRWRIEGSLTVPTNVSIEGAGIAATELYFVPVNAPLFTIGTTTTNVNNVYVRNLRILVVNTHTSGNLIKITNGYNCGLQNVRVDGAYFNCVYLVGGAQQFTYRVESCVMNGASTSNNTITVGDSTALVQDVFLSNLVLGGAIGGAAVLEQYASGVYASSIDCLGGKYGYAWIPQTGCYCKGSFYTNILGDTNKEHGLVMDPPTGTFVGDLNLNGCWGSSAGTTSSHSGVYLNGQVGTVNNINFTGITCVNNKGHGMELLGSNLYGINITNPSISNNSQSGSALAHGISLGAGVSRVNISNGHSGATQGLGPNMQGYGIIINTGVGNRLNITNMDLEGNVTGPLSNGATGSSVFIAGCAPYRTANRGSVQLSSGSTSVSVNPGLNSSFTAADVQVTPTTDLQGNRYWVTQSGSSFTINMNASLGSNMFFSWSVDTQQSRG